MNQKVINATHIANPVRANAATILDVMYSPDDGSNMLRLSDGRNFMADNSMCARYEPKIGDYLVTQEDGYEYLNPKDVFERKYTRIIPPHQQRVIDECVALSEKIVALIAFIGSSFFRTLDDAEQSRMRRQQASMSDYLDILRERIAAF